jgi:diguanylate cyclase (GGDEF)-like protein
MGPSLDKLRFNKRLMAFTAAAMYGGAAFDGSIEGLLPGDPSFAIAPVLVAIAMTALLAAIGPRVPRWGLAALGPIGVATIAYALTTTPAAGDGAVLYTWPVLWTTFFFGRRGAISIVVFIGIAHAITLLLLPAASSYPGRWVDVMVSVSVVAVVVLTLIRSNDLLLIRLADEARIDPLTGLLNRRGFEERSGLALAHARREGQPIAVVVFDVDFFKRINDDWGHAMGDRVLTRIGELLSAHARDIDVVARVGGEEFVVLLPGCSATHAEGFAERVRGALTAGEPAGLPSIGLSAGILSTATPSTIESMLQGADLALYEAKHAGRDRIVVSASRRHTRVDAGG